MFDEFLGEGIFILLFFGDIRGESMRFFVKLFCWRIRKVFRFIFIFFLVSFLIIFFRIGSLRLWE